MTDETLEQPTEINPILQAIADLGKSLNERIDNLERSSNLQFEAIRQGLVENSVRFDRLEAKILNINANLTELTEEVRRERFQTPV